MTRFAFTVSVSINGTRYAAKRIQESLEEALENWSIDQSDTIAKAFGMTLEVSAVKKEVVPS